MNREEIGDICRQWGLEIEAVEQAGTVLILSAADREGELLSPEKMKGLSEELCRQKKEIRYVTLRLEGSDGE